MRAAVRYDRTGSFDVGVLILGLGTTPYRDSVLGNHGVAWIDADCDLGIRLGFRQVMEASCRGLGLGSGFRR